MNIIIDAEIRENWNQQLIHGDITKIYRSQSSDPDQRLISIDRIRRALKPDCEVCDEKVMTLINNYFHRRRMKLAKAKQKMIHQ